MRVRNRQEMTSASWRTFRKKPQVMDFDSEASLTHRLKTDSRNAERYAGYRAVLVNLRVVSDMTDMLGCEAHICEVNHVLRL